MGRMAWDLLDGFLMNTRLQRMGGEQGRPVDGRKAHSPAPDIVTRAGTTRISLSERFGTAVGFTWAPALMAISALRGARTFHPRGDLFLGRVEVDPAADASAASLASRLVGESLIRFSDSLSKHGPLRFDVLGCAIRFGRGRSAIRGDQDLIFATIRRPWTMPLSPLATVTTDYLANDYFAVSPFSVVGDSIGSEVYFRIHPQCASAPEDSPPKPTDRQSRRDRVMHAARTGALRLLLDFSSSPWGPFRPLASIAIESELDRDPPDLFFDPFANGAGIQPRGFVHALRHGAYAGSRWGRGLCKVPRIFHGA